jgi:hypothetical protein
LKDLLKKLSLGLFIASGIMLFLIAAIAIQNLFIFEEKVKISGFYYAICVVLAFSGWYLRKISKNY